MNCKVLFIIFIFFLNGCVETNNIKFSKKPIIIDGFSNRGFALVYDDDLLKKKINIMNKTLQFIFKLFL